VALFYGTGMVFAVSAALVLVLELVRMIAGRASERDLLTVDSERT
jgi:hypothetical protein